MDNEQWVLAERRLTLVGFPVSLTCDGYDVVIIRHRLTEMRDCLVVYINGKFDRQWWRADGEERRRFCCPSTSYVFTRKGRAQFAKLKKSTLREMGIDPDKKVVTYSQIWMSFRRLKAHLIANNKTIEVASDLISQRAEMAGPIGMKGESNG